VAVSLLANIAAAPALTWQSVVVAGWPPIALLLAVELLAIGRDRTPAAVLDSPTREASDTVGDNGHCGRPQSVREAVRQVLESADSALSSSEIASAVATRQEGRSNARLRRNVANVLWGLRKAGLVATEDGRSVWTGDPILRDR
jgi:hypothetical protein